MFKYKSVFFVTFEAFDVAKEGFMYGSSESSFRWAETKGMTVPHPEYVCFGRERKSLPTNTAIRLIRLNFELKKDTQFLQTKYVLQEGLKGIELPAKIYIDAHSGYDTCSISQEFHRLGESQANYQEISEDTLVQIFSEAIPQKHGITFHFLTCKGITFARNFLKGLFEKGFSNCFAVGYTENVLISTSTYGSPQQYYIITDFSTESRDPRKQQATAANPRPITDMERRLYLHHKDKSDLPDNKFIALYEAGRVTEKPYRKWLEEHTVRYNIDRKNLFDYNFLAILSETDFFFEKQLPIIRNDSLKHLFHCYRYVIKYFMESQESVAFDPQRIITFFNSLLYSIDLWLLNKKSASERLSSILKRFQGSYEHFKKDLLVIIPQEAKQLSLDLEFTYQPPPFWSTKQRPILVTNLEDIAGIAEQMIEGRVLDFRQIIH